MSVINLVWFGGMAPRQGEQHLPAPHATDAQNTNLYSGELRPLKKPSLAHKFARPGDDDFITPEPPDITDPPDYCEPVSPLPPIPPDSGGELCVSPAWWSYKEQRCVGDRLPTEDDLAPPPDPNNDNCLPIPPGCIPVAIEESVWGAECQPYSCGAFVDEANRAGYNVSDYSETWGTPAVVPTVWETSSGIAGAYASPTLIGEDMNVNFILEQYYLWPMSDVSGQVDPCAGVDYGLGVGANPGGVPASVAFNFPSGNVTSVSYVISGGVSQVNAFDNAFNRRANIIHPAERGSEELGVAFYDSMFRERTTGAAICSPMTGDVQVLHMDLHLSDPYFRNGVWYAVRTVSVAHDTDSGSHTAEVALTYTTADMTAPTYVYNSNWSFYGLRTRIFASIQHTESITENDLNNLRLWLSRNDSSYEPPEYCSDNPGISVVGNDVTLAVSTNAGATAPVTYQWFKENVAIPGATDAIYAFEGEWDSTTEYRVKVTNPCTAGTGGVVSPPYIVEIEEKPIGPECQPQDCEAVAVIAANISGNGYWPLLDINYTSTVPTYMDEGDYSNSELLLYNSRAGGSWGSTKGTGFRYHPYTGAQETCAGGISYLMGSYYLATGITNNLQARVKNGVANELMWGGKMPNFAASVVVRGLDLRHDPYRQYTLAVATSQYYDYTENNNVGNGFMSSKCFLTQEDWSGEMRHYVRFSGLGANWNPSFDNGFFSGDDTMISVRCSHGPVTWRLNDYQGYYLALWYAFTDVTFELRVTQRSTGVTQYFTHTANDTRCAGTFNYTDNLNVPLDPERKTWQSGNYQSFTGPSSGLYSQGSYNYMMGCDRISGVIKAGPKIYIDESGASPPALTSTDELHLAWLRSFPDYTPPDYCP